MALCYNWDFCTMPRWIKHNWLNRYGQNTQAFRTFFTNASGGFGRRKGVNLAGTASSWWCRPGNCTLPPTPNRTCKFPSIRLSKYFLIIRRVIVSSLSLMRVFPCDTPDIKSGDCLRYLPLQNWENSERVWYVPDAMFWLEPLYHKSGISIDLAPVASVSSPNFHDVLIRPGFRHLLPVPYHFHRYSFLQECTDWDSGNPVSFSCYWVCQVSLHVCNEKWHCWLNIKKTRHKREFFP